MSTLKKIFFLSVFILAVSSLFWGIYNLSFKSRSSTKNTPDSTKNIPSTSNDTATDKISPISKEAVVAPVISSDKDSINYLSRKSGQIFQIDFYGNIQKTFSSENIDNLIYATWSPDKLGLITQSKNQNGLFYFHNLNTKTKTPLKDNLDQIVWQTNANRILYKYYDAKTKTRTLNVSDPDGSNWLKLFDLTYKNISIAQIPRTGLISFWNTGDAFLQTNFQAVPAIGGTVKTIDTSSFGSDYLWNSDGDKALISHADAKGGFKIELGIMNANGGEYKSLGIPTFVTKCAWSQDGKTVYYALPGGIPDNSVLPNDYKDNKFQTTDTFWKVDVTNGKKTRVVEISDIKDQYDVSQPFLNKSESLLFFVNKLDDKLYKVSL